MIRWIFLALFFASAALLGAGLYLQAAEGLAPCPLCVAQRLAWWAIGLTALLAFFHNPARWGRRLYGLLLAAFAVAGGAVALRQVWLLRHPASFECGISPEERLLDALPLAEWWPAMFQAEGDCAEISWRFLSLTIPDWSLACFVTFALVAGYLIRARR